MHPGLSQRGRTFHHVVLPSSLAVLLAAAVTLGACGGNNTNNSTGTSPAGSSSPAIISAGDAPMSSVLAALVTISAVGFTSSSGTVQLLSQPRTIELTHLGGIRAPLDTHALPEGTYTSLSLTVSAAQITYIDPTTGQPVEANATIPAASATSTITLTTPLVVNDAGATDIRFDFDLQKSLDLTGGVVTFTPTIGAAVARVQGESGADRDIDINGDVTAVSTTANTIMLTTSDTGLSVTVNVTSSTKFDDGLSLASLQTGADIHVDAELNSDGSLSALDVEDADGGSETGANTRVDGGIVSAVTRDTNNTLTGFTIVVRDSFQFGNLGKMLTVQVNTATLFKDSMNAQSAGMASFDDTQIFPGAGVWVAGTDVDAHTVLATEVRPLAVNPFGLTSAAVQTGSNGGFVLTLLLDANTNFDQFANISSLAVDTNANTVFDGQGLTSANVASLAIGTPVVARGFLSLSGTANTLFCDHLLEEGAGH